VSSVTATQATARVRPIRVPLVLASLAFLAAACDYFDRDLRPGSYRATLETPVGELPFGLDIAQESGRFVLFLINGEERVRIDDVRLDDQHRLQASVPGSQATLALEVRRRSLEGELRLPRKGSQPLTLPVRAEYGKTHRFFERPLTDNADVQGRWSVVVSRDGVDTVPAVAEFLQRFERVTGRVRTREANGPLLVGEVHDEALFLSSFDGRTAVLLRATVDARGALDGEIWSSAAGAARLQAIRNPDAVL
jgi:hypothetical protein